MLSSSHFELNSYFVGTQSRATFENQIIPLLYGNTRLACQDILLMLNGVGMARHTTARLHNKAAQGKIGSFLR